LIKGLSSRFYKKAKRVVGKKANTATTIARHDTVTEKTKATTTTTATADADTPSSTEIILKYEEAIGLNEKMAQQISKNGIQCKAITDIGSLEIERKPCYSYLFPLSTRIVTNRGYIKLEGNGTRNIDLIQIIQKN
jgi:hypothetical protein